MYGVVLYVYRPMFRSYQPKDDELKEFKLQKAKPIEGLWVCIDEFLAILHILHVYVVCFTCGLSLCQITTGQ